LPALLYIAAMVAAMPGTPAMPENTEPDRREAPAPATGWSPFDAFFGPPGPPRPGAVSWLWARFLFLRALGLVFFSAFYSPAFQPPGLLAPPGLLPAGPYLAGVARAFPVARFWSAPPLLWLSASDAALTALVVAGFAASLALTCNLWPRASLAVAT